eukprot:Amastigsp_a344992_28.p3 type:complete len:197 gc:universal Amastigsp_a344992_28:1-591(+)
MGAGAWRGPAARRCGCARRRRRESRLGRRAQPAGACAACSCGALCCRASRGGVRGVRVVRRVVRSAAAGAGGASSGGHACGAQAAHRAAHGAHPSRVEGHARGAPPSGPPRQETRAPQDLCARVRGELCCRQRLRHRPRARRAQQDDTQAQGRAKGRHAGAATRRRLPCRRSGPQAQARRRRVQGQAQGDLFGPRE